MKPPLWQRLDDRFEPSRKRRALAEQAALLARDSTDSDSTDSDSTDSDSTDSGAPGGRAPVIALALLVHAFWLLLVLGAAAVFLTGLFIAVEVFLAAVLLSVAWVVRPRVTRMGDLHDEDALELDRAATPTLFGVLDRVTAAVGGRTPVHVFVDGEYNASCSRVGWRQQRVLVLGLPLVAVLTRSELVAMLAHETAHDVNGDTRHGLVVGSAMRSLYEWDAVLTPPDRVRSDGSLAEQLGDALAVVVFTVASAVPRALGWVLYRQALPGWWGIDSRHPPTALRLELLQSRPARPAELSLTEGEHAAVVAELRPVAERVARPVLQRLRY